MNFQSGHNKGLETGYKPKTYLGVLGFIFSSGRTGYIQNKQFLRSDPDNKFQRFQNDTSNSQKHLCKQVVPVQHSKSNSQKILQFQTRDLTEVQFFPFALFYFQ